MNNEIVYVAELDQDVDDVIAVRYLHMQHALKCVVLDPYPISKIGLERLKSLETLGIPIRKIMPSNAPFVFVGGPLTIIADYIKTHTIDTLVMNGGFVGCNIATDVLPKFKDKETIRTFNFNSDLHATDEVLRSHRIGHIILVGKNVCHDERNTRTGFWSDSKYQKIFDEYQVNDKKLMHDLLACHDGLALLSGTPTLCKFETVRPYNNGLNYTHTLWGSTKTKNTPYLEVLAATGFRPNISDYDMSPENKKNNMAYWDDMEQQCRNLLDNLLTNYAYADTSKLDEDARIDISKVILDTVINQCKKYDIDTNKAFPFIDTDYQKKTPTAYGFHCVCY